MEGTMDKVKKEAKRIYDLAMGNKKAAAIVVAAIVIVIILI
jgi:hypothetical protein